MGELKTGYKADFVILDRDIFTILPEEIDKVQVDKTYISGNCVFDRLFNF